MDNIKPATMNHHDSHGLIGVFITVTFGFISMQTAQVWAYMGTGFAGLFTGIYYIVKTYLDWKERGRKKPMKPMKKPH